MSLDKGFLGGWGKVQRRAGENKREKDDHGSGPVVVQQKETLKKIH